MVVQEVRVWVQGPGQGVVCLGLEISHPVATRAWSWEARVAM